MLLVKYVKSIFLGTKQERQWILKGKWRIFNTATLSSNSLDFAVHVLLDFWLMTTFKLKSFLLLVFMILPSRFSYASETILLVLLPQHIDVLQDQLPKTFVLLSTLMASGTTYTQLPSLATIDILGHIIRHCGDCPVYCRMFGNIPGLYPLDASVAPTPVATNKTISKHC